MYFILLGAILMGAGWVPIVRKIWLLETSSSLSLATIITIITFWIGGLMAGLTGMIQSARKEASLAVKKNSRTDQEHGIASLCHLSGLLFYTGLPFANFLVCFLLWQRYRRQSIIIDQHGMEAINFQICHALYLLLSLFLIFAFGFGIILAAILSIVHISLTLAAAISAYRQKTFYYPANIKIIQSAS